MDIKLKIKFDSGKEIELDQKEIEELRCFFVLIPPYPPVTISPFKTGTGMPTYDTVTKTDSH